MRGTTVKQPYLLPAGLVALSVMLGTPAFAQMKTSKPSGSPAATPAPKRTTTQQVAPAQPLGLRVFGAYDFMGTVNTGGFVPATTQAPGVTAPALAQASPSVPASGYSLGAEYDLPVLTLGARYQTFSFASPLTAAINNPPTGVTQTSVTGFETFFPANYWELYGRLGALKLGYRAESYPGAATYSGTYGDLVAGLNFGFGIDPVALNIGLLGGYGLSKPANVPSNIAHMPAEGDVNLSFNFGMLKAKLGYKAVAVANADTGALVTVLTNPSSLIPAPGSTPDTNLLNTLYNTRYGLYTGPYAGLEVAF